MQYEKHGKSWTREYIVWKNMIQRCCNPNFPRYNDYGGRGIAIYSSWRKSFHKFITDVGFAPSNGHSLDRFPDNNGNYEPGNVRWALIKEQSINKRKYKISRVFEYNGELFSKSQLAELRNISVEAFIWREKNGWSLAKIMSTPKS